MAASLLAAGCMGSGDFEINVTPDNAIAEFPESMYGIFFEEINHAGDGGLYAELLMNRSFEEKVIPEGGYRIENNELVAPPVINHLKGEPTPGRYRWHESPYPGWDIRKEGGASASARITTASPNFKTAPSSLVLTVSNAGEGVYLENSGYWGINYVKGNFYKLRTFIKSNMECAITAMLTDSNGKELGQKKIFLEGDNKWHEFTADIEALEDCKTGKFCFEITDNATISFDYVSLFPENTYKGRENGMRKDVAEMLEGLNPEFIRWPGGCIVEGITLTNRVEWKKTLGDPAARPGQYDTWGYRNTYGFGYREFLELCEDLDAGGMYVCNVGISCQARSGEACSDKEAEYYLQDALDAIEYAIGDISTKWGSVRAEEGHPEPYPLKYVEIGNENSGPVYDRRFDMFYAAIKEKYPELVLISNHGIGGIGNATKTDMVDPHWYVSPDFFFENAGIFDNLERGKHTIYVGEYACNQGVGAGNMLAALSEAAFLTGMERNCDIVKMASYAPLFENRNDRTWPTNLIWISPDQVVGRTSYYVQKMFSHNRPTHVVSSQSAVMKSDPVVPFISNGGHIGFGTWSTQASFRNLRAKTAEGDWVEADIDNASEWNMGLGDWKTENGVLSQTGNENRTVMMWNKINICPGTVIEFEARKDGGSEGFLTYLDIKDTGVHSGYMLNSFGWGNSSTAMEKLSDSGSGVVSEMVGDRIDDNGWHKVRIAVNETGAVYSFDGKEILRFENKPVPKFFHTAGVDRNTGEVILKVVNAFDTRTTGKIRINDVSIASSGEITVLKALNQTDENSFANPEYIVPETLHYDRFSSSFTYSFEANSVTVLRMKIEKGK